MAGALHGVIASLAGRITDAFFRYVSLLLNTTSTNGAQNNTFLDSSTNNFSITRNGNTTQGTFSPFSQTGWSNFFDGTGDFLSVADNVALRMGSGTFTLEAWVFRNASGAAHTIFAKGGASTGLVLGITSTNVLRFTDTTTNIDSTGTISVGVWTHVAAVREGTGANQLRLYINGMNDGTGTSATNFTQTEEFRIGRDRSGAADFNGYISNARVVNGTAVYTSNFTPPTSPLTNITNTSLLTCQSNRFIDNSSNAFAITRNGDVSVQAFSPFAPTAAWSAGTNGGSGYFDGTGDYLTTPTTTALSFGTGDFTVECWVYKTAAGNSSIIDGRVNPGAAFPWAFYIDASNFPYFYEGTVYTSSVAVLLNTWAHVAVTRSSGTLRIFVNGVQGYSATVTTNLDRTAGALIGAAANTTVPQAYHQGYMCDLRIVKGTAVYTAAFTPPTAPLTAITNTSLLLNFTNAGIFDSASGNALETVGNAQVSTVQSKWGTTSMAFDGTGDWLLNIDKPALRLGTAAFTIEMWVYRSASGTYGLVSKGTSTTGWSVSLNASNQVVFSFAASSFNSTGTVAATTWTHIAVVREGTGTNQTKIYINGTNDGTGTVATDFNQTNAMYVGADRVAGGAFNGYIDDLRITNGYARYTSNFTAPTAAFPLQ